MARICKSKLVIGHHYHSTHLRACDRKAGLRVTGNVSKTDVLLMGMVILECIKRMKIIACHYLNISEGRFSPFFISCFVLFYMDCSLAHTYVYIY